MVSKDFKAVIMIQSGIHFLLSYSVVDILTLHIRFCILWYIGKTLHMYCVLWTPSGYYSMAASVAGVQLLSPVVTYVSKFLVDSLIYITRAWRRFLNDIVLQTNFDVYTTLDISQGAFRLLRISPGRFSDALECSIGPESWETATYEALSYVWGDRRSIQPIKVNGKRFFVTTELCLALRHLRHVRSERIMWVDAICINQHDPQERNIQVQKMACIYQHAKQVIVWLGNSHLPGTKYAFENLEHLTSNWQTIHNLYVLGGSFKAIKRMVFDQLSNFANQFSSPKISENDRAYFCLEGILNAAWWQRVWVIQEVALSSKVVFQCGPHTVSWEDVHAAARRLPLKFWPQWPNTVPAVNNISVRVHCAMDDFLSLRDVHRSNQSSLLEVAHRSGSRHATDSRDKLYGLLGLVTCNVDKEIIPDYFQPAPLIYVEIFRRHLTLHHDLFILSLAEYRGRHGRELPSWCCDWTVECLHPAPFWTNEWKVARSPWDERICQAKQRLYHAAGNTVVEIVPCLSTRVLGLRGYIVDRIREVGHARTRRKILQDEEIDQYNEPLRLEKEIKRELSSGVKSFEAATLIVDFLQASHNKVLRFGYSVGREQYIMSSEFIWLMRTFYNYVIGKSKYGWSYLSGTCHAYPESKYLSAFENTLTAGILPDSKAYNEILQVWREAEHSFATLGKEEQHKKLSLYLVSLATNYRRFIATIKGYMGLVPIGTRKGDIICIFLGANVPFILRKKGDNYLVIGQAYVNAYMENDQENIQRGIRDTEIELQTFFLC